MNKSIPPLLVASAAVVLSGCWHAAQPGTDYIETDYIEYAADVAHADHRSQSIPGFAGFAEIENLVPGDDGFYIGGVNPEQSTAEYFDRGDTEDFSIETLEASSDRQVLMVNRLGLAAGLAQDERLLLLFKKAGGTQAAMIPGGMWRIVRSGKQQRCRGSADWQAAACEW